MGDEISQEKMDNPKYENVKADEKSTTAPRSTSTQSDGDDDMNNSSGLNCCGGSEKDHELEIQVEPTASQDDTNKEDEQKVGSVFDLCCKYNDEAEEEETIQITKAPTVTFKTHSTSSSQEVASDTAEASGAFACCKSGATTEEELSIEKKEVTPENSSHDSSHEEKEASGFFACCKSGATVEDEFSIEKEEATPEKASHDSSDEEKEASGAFACCKSGATVEDETSIGELIDQDGSSEDEKSAGLFSCCGTEGTNSDDEISVRTVSMSDGDIRKQKTIVEVKPKTDLNNLQQDLERKEEEQKRKIEQRLERERQKKEEREARKAVILAEKEQEVLKPKEKVDSIEEGHGVFLLWNDKTNRFYQLYVPEDRPLEKVGDTEMVFVARGIPTSKTQIPPFKYKRQGGLFEHMKPVTSIQTAIATYAQGLSVFARYRLKIVLPQSVTFTNFGNKMFSLFGFWNDHLIEFDGSQVTEGLAEPLGACSVALVNPQAVPKDWLSGMKINWSKYSADLNYCRAQEIYNR